MRAIFLGAATLLVAACATKPRPAEPVERPAPTVSVAGENIDVRGLASSLKMLREPGDLGFREKPFNSCQVGFGYSSSHNCRNLYLMAVNFRIQCRDSEGTVELVTNEELRDLGARHVAWSVLDQVGATTTDGEGYGQVLAVVKKSARSQRLKLATQEDFLIMKAGEVRRIIVPRPWCEN